MDGHYQFGKDTIQNSFQPLKSGFLIDSPIIDQSIFPHFVDLSTDGCFLDSSPLSSFGMTGEPTLSSLQFLSSNNADSSCSKVKDDNSGNEVLFIIFMLCYWYG